MSNRLYFIIDENGKPKLTDRETYEKFEKENREKYYRIVYNPATGWKTDYIFQGDNDTDPDDPKPFGTSDTMMDLADYDLLIAEGREFEGVDLLKLREEVAKIPEDSELYDSIYINRYSTWEEALAYKGCLDVEVVKLPFADADIMDSEEVKAEAKRIWEENLGDGTNYAQKLIQSILQDNIGQEIEDQKVFIENGELRSRTLNRVMINIELFKMSLDTLTDENERSAIFKVLQGMEELQAILKTKVASLQSA